MKPKVIVAPDFRTVDEIFDPPTLERLHDLAELIWGRDGPMHQDRFESALQDALQESIVRTGRTYRTSIKACREHRPFPGLGPTAPFW